MKIKLFIVVSLLLSTFLAGCAEDKDESADDHDGHTHETTENGDIREETSSLDVQPAFLEEKPEEVQDIYFAVSKNKDLLEQMPCYCGCGETAGHRDNYDCFISENHEDGSLVWDDHGTKCGVCLEIAAQAIVDHQDGKSVEDIREDIDEKYEKGYADPTPTPEV
ncbi:PCYCGC domain-containing protein [Halobacillus sp. A1]|uniref:PCYCGC domain-containing protein n=1 Tax=Halobacillus sp. A1 TaxID=2880262 RepID=UPI0020A6C517|nr:PCYCGC domain-containing protein [Halobacillus sp. A1]MCP3031769.1 PCYCGC domain-containing protein [Halobacillus sp. A1]